MTAATVEEIDAGLCGHVADYDVFLAGDSVRIIEDTDTDPAHVEREIGGLGDHVQDADDLRLGWAELPDGSEVVYVYDKADGCYGYAVNLSSRMLSEWGYAPFRGEIL